MPKERLTRTNQQPPTQNAEQLIGKSLPSSIEAERAVLGALLLNDEHLTLVSEILIPTDFYNQHNSVIYAAMIDLHHQRKRIDVLTLQDELIKRNQLEDVGGVFYLVSLQEDLPAIGLIEQHARIIKEKAILRDLINSASGIIGDCYNQREKQLGCILDQAEQAIFKISNNRASESFVQLNIWLKKTFKHLSDIKSHSKGITGIPSGYKKLDLMSSGFQKGDLIVLAARPSMGKTALALSIGEYAALHGYAVGVFSLEMSAEQLTLRLLSSVAHIAHQNIRNATITSDEWVELTNVAAQLAEVKLFIDDTAGISLHGTSSTRPQAKSRT